MKLNDVVGVPVPHPVGVPVPQIIKVPVPQPYAVHVPVPHPIAVPIYKLVPQEIEKKVPITVEKLVPVYVDKPYKIVIEKHHPVYVDKPYPVHVPVYKHVRTRQAQSAHPFVVNLERCRTALYQDSFIHRTARLWNSLPVEIGFMPGVHSRAMLIRSNLPPNWGNLNFYDWSRRYYCRNVVFCVEKKFEVVDIVITGVSPDLR
ncbi:unnamed protein product [Phaedon cochleariae]|uniref:Uncharacterized protein n=1 Tax=Phaedon cochleariae TaxID=80249 RepID=A0A9N9S8D9_PHACE|nr:unnamed protein product [Phaedon cochleariae]